MVDGKEIQPIITSKDFAEAAESNKVEITFTEKFKSEKPVYFQTPNYAKASDEELKNERRREILPNRPPAVAVGDYSLIYPLGAETFSLYDANCQKVAELLRGKVDTIDYSYASNDPPQVHIEAYKNFVVIRKGSNFIAYITHNEANVPLPPRNWIKVDKNSDTLDSHLELRTYINMARYMDAKHFAIVNDKYIATTDSGIRIQDSADRTRAFEDNVGFIYDNVCIDPKDPSVIYYKTSRDSGDESKAIYKLDTSGTDPNLWQAQRAVMPVGYGETYHLQLDPTGTFFLLDNKHGGISVLRKDTLEKVIHLRGSHSPHFDTKGRLRVINEKGYLVAYDANFKEAALKIERAQVAEVAKGLTVDLFADEVSGQSAAAPVEDFSHLDPLKEQAEQIVLSELANVTTVFGMDKITLAVNRLDERLKNQGLSEKERAFITQDIAKQVQAKQHDLAAPQIQSVVDKVASDIAQSDVTLTALTRARESLSGLDTIAGLVDEDTRKKIVSAQEAVSEKTRELFRTQSSAIEANVQKLVTGVETEIQNMQNVHEFSDWQEFRLPQMLSYLATLAHESPVEAVETQKRILEARRHLQDIARQQDTRFKTQYAEIREEAAQVQQATVDMLGEEISQFADRLRTKGFTNRSQAQQYIASSEARKVLDAEIDALRAKNPDEAKRLERELKTTLSLVYSEIERGSKTGVAETGQQMTYFGETPFPIWEAKVKQKRERRFDVVFLPNPQSTGPGVSADDVMGDVGIMTWTSRGGIEKTRLYEDMPDEETRRYGATKYRGADIPPSYVSLREFKAIKADYEDWKRQDHSKLRREEQEYRNKLSQLYTSRNKPEERESEDKSWRDEYEKALGDYATFYAKHHLSLLKRMDTVKQTPEVEYTNGKGFVPEWQSHWVVDDQTETYLSEMAKAAKMQLDLQEGILNLKGHAGTGKDVLVKMFASRTKRPYFSIDCSKWTTEFELSEDVTLESVNGASQTVKVPSTVLSAITTPGAIMYFNEINAMPEQAQIFLHGLLDEKRTLTLKTSSGKAVKAEPSVLLFSSMNPGYPGTFDPQFATESRMIPLEIDYPPLHAKRAEGDQNPSQPYNAAEALRIARSVSSLEDLTYDPNLKHNEFVNMWDSYVNGMKTDAPQPTAIQRFDMDVILALVQFSEKLRENFIAQFDKSRSARNALPVNQPITGREMRRFAYDLSHLAEEKKVQGNPEAVARSLIEKYFLTHIRSSEDRDKIRTAMATWTSSKRPAR